MRRTHGGGAAALVQATGSYDGGTSDIAEKPQDSHKSTEVCSFACFTERPQEALQRYSEFRKIRTRCEGESTVSYWQTWALLFHVQLSHCRRAEIRVESVRLPLPASPPISIAQSKSTLPGTLDRILEPQTERWTQRWASSIAPAKAKFCRQMAASPRTYKIHAEIQLLFYYEMHPDYIMRPRVICSSKSACFLCDLFVKIHAKFYVARTHGVLYDKWILPGQGTIHLLGKGVKDMTRVVELFKATLEDRIRLTLPLLRMPRFHPNESVLVEPAIWTPSAVSLASNTASQVITAMLNSEACLKNQPETMGDIEAFHERRSGCRWKMLELNRSDVVRAKARKRRVL